MPRWQFSLKTIAISVHLYMSIQLIVYMRLITSIDAEQEQERT